MACQIQHLSLNVPKIWSCLNVAPRIFGGVLADFSQGSDKKRVATAARLYDGLKLRAGARGGSLDGIQQPNLHTPPPPPSPWGGTEHGFLRFCKLYFSASVNWISQILNMHFSGIQPATQFVLYLCWQ